MIKLPLRSFFGFQLEISLSLYLLEGPQYSRAQMCADAKYIMAYFVEEYGLKIFVLSRCNGERNWP